MRRTFVIAALAVSALAGCSSNGLKQPTQKEAAFAQWNNARSSVLVTLAQDQFKTGHYDKSRKTVNEALKLSPENPDLWVLSAKLNIEQSQLEVAERDLLKAAELDPTRAEPHYLLGVVNQRWQRLPKALESYEKANDLATGELAYLLARAETLVAMDRSKEALALLEERLPFFENNPVIRDAVGQLMMEQGRYRDAADMFRQATLLATDDLNLKERYAKALFFDNRHRECADLLNRIIKDERTGERADLQVMLGEACLAADRPTEARRAFEMATQINPDSIQGWQGVAKVALNMNDLRRAEMAIRRSIAIDPADAQSQLLMGYLRLTQGKLNDAMLAFRKASTLDTQDPVALCMTGYVFDQLGDHQQAMDYYGRALNIKPGDELATRLMAGVGMND